MLLDYDPVVFVSQVSLQYRDVSVSGRAVSVRAQVTTEAPAKVVKESKKQDEGVIVNKFKPKEPYIGRCLLNTKITGDDAPGETWHMVFSTEGILFSFTIHNMNLAVKKKKICKFPLFQEKFRTEKDNQLG